MAPPKAVRKDNLPAFSAIARRPATRLVGLRYFTDAHREYCLAQDPPELERAELCAQVNQKIYPEGMDIVNASYLAESGNAARIDKLLKEEPWMGDLLKTILAPGNQSLLDVARAWLASGKKLGELEHDREEHLAALEAKAAPPTTIQAARNQWFQIIRTVLANLEVSSAPAEAIAAIRGPIERASERAGKRYGGGKAAAPVDEDDAVELEERGAAAPA